MIAEEGGEQKWVHQHGQFERLLSGETRCLSHREIEQMRSVESVRAKAVLGVLVLAAALFEEYAVGLRMRLAESGRSIWVLCEDRAKIEAGLALVLVLARGVAQLEDRADALEAYRH